jgi:hypothetical protein
MVFALEVVSVLEELLPAYKPVEELKYLLSFNEYGSKTNIPYFKSLKGMKVRYEEDN